MSDLLSPTGDIPAIRAPKPRGLKQTFILGFNNPENLFCRGVWIRILCIVEQFLCRDGSGKTRALGVGGKFHPARSSGTVFPPNQDKAGRTIVNI